MWTKKDSKRCPSVGDAVIIKTRGGEVIGPVLAESVIWVDYNEKSDIVEYVNLIGYMYEAYKNGIHKWSPKSDSTPNMPCHPYDTVSVLFKDGSQKHCLGEDIDWSSQGGIIFYGIVEKADRNAVSIKYNKFSSMTTVSVGDRSLIISTAMEGSIDIKDDCGHCYNNSDLSLREALGYLLSRGD